MKVGHVHRWTLESPNGEPTVIGRCRCKRVREFPAQWEPSWTVSNGMRLKAANARRKGLAASMGAR